MTCYDAIPARSAGDLPYELAAERYAALRDERDRTRAAVVAAGTSDDATTVGEGAIHRVRGVVGRRLVALGSAIDPAPLSRSSSRSAGR